jgi:hypothetical protein
MDAIEVCKVRVNLKHPVALCDDDCTDVNATNRGGQERLILKPSDDVV